MSPARTIATILLSILILAAVGFSYQSYTEAEETPTPAALAPRAPTPAMVTARGVVTPTRSVTLSFRLAARVVTVMQGAETRVKQGDVLARLDDSILQKQIAQQAAAVGLAEKELEQLQAGGTPEQITAAQAALDAANENYARVKQGPSLDKLKPLKANLDSAKTAVAEAQAAYDRAGGASNPTIGQTREAFQLQQATNNYNAALGAYTDAVSHPSPAELATAYAQVQQAEQALAGLTPSRQALGVAQAQVDSARSALDLSRAELSDYVLVAPFDGVITSKSIEMGQVVQPGQPALVLCDLSKLQVETTDLSEADAPRVRLGAPVNVSSVDIPGKLFPGTVSQVAPLDGGPGAKLVQVTVDLSSPAPLELKWGMTTNLDIMTSQ